jgi:hypothetical protein
LSVTAGLSKDTPATRTTAASFPTSLSSLHDENEMQNAAIEMQNAECKMQNLAGDNMLPFIDDCF